MSNRPPDDRRRLEHIEDACTYAINGYAKIGDEQLEDGDLRYFGLLQLIQTIGEAAYQLTREFKADHPEVPWRQIIGMRHILVHEYDKIEEQFVWRVLRDELPKLKAQVEQLLAVLPK